MKIGDRFWRVSRTRYLVGEKITNGTWLKYHSPHSTLIDAKKRILVCKCAYKLLNVNYLDNELLYIYRTEVTAIDHVGHVGIITKEYTFKEFERYCKISKL